MPSDEDAAFRSFVSVATAHHVNTNGRFAIYSVLDSLEPVIEPSQMESPKIQCRIFCELCLAGVIAILRAVNPRSDNQSLQVLLCFSQLNKIDISDLCAPRVVPT